MPEYSQAVFIAGAQPDGEYQTRTLEAASSGFAQDWMRIDVVALPAHTGYTNHCASA